MHSAWSKLKTPYSFGRSECNRVSIYFYADKDRQCGGLLTQAPGIINTADRNNDGNYDVHLYCVWAMIAPANTSIELQFLSFDVEYVTNCIFDNVQVCKLYHVK